MTSYKIEKITLKDLEKSYNFALKVHSQHLAMDNVKMPSWKSAKAYQLSILIYAYKNDLGQVHKDQISDIVRKFKPNAGSDQQVRHLKRDGWNIEGKNGYHYFIDIYTTHSGFSRDQLRRSKTLIASSFDDIKKLFGDKCATCGAFDGEPDPRYPRGEIVKLQQGHRDPHKSLDNENIIPQCQYCNKSYKDDFVFDEKGRVRCVANSKPVTRASRDVQKEVADALIKKGIIK